MDTNELLNMETILAEPVEGVFVPVPHAKTMGNLDKVRYTHSDMIDFIIANPWVSQNELAARYGYTPAWVSNIMASDAWQAAMASRRDEVVDPALKASLEERFKGVVIQSLNRLQEKLNAPQVSDQVVLRAVELGARACGLGGKAAPTESAGAPVINIFNSTTLADYANRKLADYSATVIEQGTS
jgi:hypothetical protein